MNKQILLLVVCVGTAHAHLIDLTPGGFDIDQGLPPAFERLQTHIFFDEAAHGFFDLPEGTQYLDGWVSRFGALNGGTYFFTDLLGRDTPTASIWWDFTNAPNGYWLTTIDVFGRRADGSPWENIYGVSFGQRFEGIGSVTLDGFTTIMGISLYGLNPATVPDTADTSALFILGLGALLLGLGSIPRKTV
jgi:hypothetical protein